MKKLLLWISATLGALLLMASAHRNHPAVVIGTTSLDKTSANGVTLKYVVRGYEATTLSGVEHGSCLNTLPNPEVGKAGSKTSKGVAGTTDPKGKPAAAGTFYCAAFTNGLLPATKYYVKPYLKLKDGTIIYGSERSITMP